MYAFTFTAHNTKFLLPKVVFDDPKNLSSQNLRAETTTTHKLCSHATTSTTTPSTPF